MKYKPVIGTANQKGGVGKTTNIRIIAEYLAIYGNKKILLCDMDTQYSLSARYLGVHKNQVTGKKEPPIHPSYKPTDPSHQKWDGKSSIGNIFFGEGVRPYSTRIPNIEIAPSDEKKLSEAEDVKRQEIAELVYCQLYKFITSPDIQSAYDAFLIDTPPAKSSPLTMAAFKAMTHLIIPLEIETQSLEGLQGILTLWKQEALQRPADYPLHLLGILPNKVHSRRAHDKGLLKNLEKGHLKEYLMPMQLVDRKQYPEADYYNKSIFDLPEGDEAKIECIQLGKFIEARVFQ